MRKKLFDLYEFNRLNDRPEPLMPDTPDLIDLERAFPFLFKPNRVLALHPRQDTYDPGKPEEDGQDRWLIRLVPSIPVSGLADYLFALSPRDRLTLWRFETFPGRSGLYPVRLENLAAPCAEPRHEITLAVDKASGDALPPPLRLLKVEQTTDADGWHYVRLETRRGRHFLAFDLMGLLRDADRLAYYYASYPQITPRNGASCSFTASSENDCPPSETSSATCPVYRQIGGWGQAEAIYWCDDHKQIVMSGKSGNSPFRLHAAVKYGNNTIIAGGEDTCLLRFDPDTRQPLPLETQLKGYVFSLELLPSADEAAPYLLATCDDNRLYVLDIQGKILQKAELHGRGQGIAILRTAPGLWADLAIAVRNRGLFCARIFLDRLRGADDFEEDREIYRQLVDKLIDANPDTLRNWLSDKQQPYRQLPAMLHIANHPSEEKVALFQPEAGLLYALHEDALAYLVHAVHRKLIRWSPEQSDNGGISPQCVKWLMQLLLYLARGPYPVRMAVRSLEGWLSRLEEDVCRQRPFLEDLQTLLPDAKRYLRKLAGEICSSDPLLPGQDDDRLGIFVSVCERLYHERAFNEIIMRRLSAPVTVVCMIGPPHATDNNEELTPWFVWAHSTGNRLYAFRNQPSPQRVLPIKGKGVWNHALFDSARDSEETRRDRLPVRSLCPLPGRYDYLLVAGGKSLGLAHKEGTAIEWQCQLPYAIYAVSIHASGRWLAVGGECQKDENFLRVIQIQGDGIDGYALKQGQTLPLPKTLSPPFTLRALEWDKEGNLWGITSGQSYLLCWPGLEMSRPQQAELVNRLPSNQYALATWEHLILCGGEDGVIRAFRRDGDLAWLFIAKGAVRSIRLLPGHSSEHAYFAVISEEEHIWTLDHRGQRYNLFFLLHQHPLCLAAGQVRKEGTVHYLVGTNEGEVRLVEMVFTREEWQCLNYLQTVLGGLPENMRAGMEQRLEAHKRSPEALGQWCREEAIRAEPTRAAWAVRHLIEQHGDFETAIKCLEAIRHDDEPSVCKFRVHVFGAISSHFKACPPELVRRMVRETAHVQDGSLSRLLIHLNDTDNFTAALYRYRLLRLVRKKLARAKSFTSSSFLQVLARPTAERMLEYTVIWILRQSQRDPDFILRLHWGFSEGILGLLFNALPAHHSLLDTLSSLCERYKNLSRRFKRQSGDTARFMDWLDRNAALLFTLEHARAWKVLLPYLKSREGRFDTQGFLTSLAQARDVSPKEREHLDILAGFFPQPRAFRAWPNAPRCWQAIHNLARQFHERRTNIQRGSLSAREVKQAITASLSELDAYQPESALLSPVQIAWQRAWIDEFRRLSVNNLPDRPADYLHLIYERQMQFVEGEAIPLALYLRNDGPEDLQETVRLWLNQAKQRRLAPGEPEQAECAALRCASATQAGEQLVLHTRLLPFYQANPKPLEFDVCWQVKDDTRCQTVKLQFQARWHTYRQQFPRQDDLAVHLLNQKHAGEYCYRRLVIKIWRDALPKLSAKELSALAREWAARSGREHGLRLVTPEAAWAGLGAEVFEKSRWQARLAETPLKDKLEIWLVENALPWNLAFLETLDSAPATALFLPQLTVADNTQANRLPYFLDTLLSPRGPCLMAPLQWALKACTQGIQDIPAKVSKNLPPVLLGSDIRHGKHRVLRQGTLPDKPTWEDPQYGIWPVAGAERSEDAAHVSTAGLPADAAKPLSALMAPRIFRWLWRMGLAARWHTLWVPRSALLLDYADKLYPTRPVMNDKPALSGPFWSWSTAGWRGPALQQARNALFGKRDRTPLMLPYEGFGFGEWEKLKEYATHEALALPEVFFDLLELPGRQAYLEIQNSQQQWRQILSGHSDFQHFLLKRLRNQQIEVTELPGQWKEGILALLRLDFPGTRFSRMALLLPSDHFRARLRQAGEAQINLLAEALRQTQKTLHDQPDWKAAVILVLYDLPENQRRQGGLPGYDAVFISERQLNRLMNTHRAVGQALLEIAQTQVPLGEIAQKEFTLKGPVPTTHFFGRTAPLKRLAEGLLAGKSYVITGPRGIGKSSLLRYLPRSPLWQSRLEDRFFPVELDLQMQRFGLNYGRFLAGLSQAVPLPSAGLPGEIARLQQLSGNATVTSRDIAEQALTLTEQVLENFAKYAAGRIPLFLFDEVDGFYQFDGQCGEPIFTLFRAWHNKGRAQFLFASYPPQAESMANGLQDARRQSYNFVEQEILSPLELEEGIDLVRTGLGRLGIRPTPPQAQHIAEECFAIPSLLQHACLELCKGLQQQLERGEGNELGQTLISETARTAQQAFLAGQFALLQPEQVKYALVGLVLENKNEFSLSDACQAFAKHAGSGWDQKKVQKALQSVLQTLILSFDERRGLYHFAGPAEHPYFPTMSRNAYGDSLEDMILREMEGGRP